MQPKRDPNDRRFWPVRIGGTSGFGVQRYGKPSPYRYGAIGKRDRGSLGNRPDSLRVTTGELVEQAAKLDAEAVRARARVVSIRLLDDVEERASSMDNSELINALGQALKATGAVSTGANVANTINLGSLHLDALRHASARIAHTYSSVDDTAGHTLANVDDAKLLPDSEIDSDA